MSVLRTHQDSLNAIARAQSAQVRATRLELLVTSPLAILSLPTMSATRRFVAQYVQREEGGAGMPPQGAAVA